MKSQRIAIATLILLLVCGAGLGVFWIVVNSSDDKSPELEVASDGSTAAPAQHPDSLPARKTPQTETRKTLGTVETHDAGTPAGKPASADSTPVINRRTEDRPTRETSRLERSRDGVRSFPGSNAGEQPLEEFRVTIRGQVVDRSGHGIANAQVQGIFTPTAFDPNASGAARARHRARLSSGELGVITTTDSAGYFEAVIAPKAAQAVTRIDVTLTAECSGYVSDGKMSVKGLSKGESRDGISVKLTRGGSVSGKVVDMHGQPVAGVFIHATPVRGGRGTPFGLTLDPRNQAKSDANGVYRFDALKQGEWNLDVNSAGHHKVSGPDRVTVEASRDVTLSDFVVTLRTTVKIRVLNESGEPINATKDSSSNAGTPKTRPAPISAVVTYGGGKTRRVTSLVVEDGEAAFIGVPDDATQMTIDMAGYKTSDPVQLSITPNQENHAGDVRLTRLEKTD